MNMMNLMNLFSDSATDICFCKPAILTGLTKQNDSPGFWGSKFISSFKNLRKAAYSLKRLFSTPKSNKNDEFMYSHEQTWGLFPDFAMALMNLGFLNELSFLQVHYKFIGKPNLFMKGETI